MTPADILSIVNVKLKNDAISEDDRIFTIEEIEQVILNYCHIENIPVVLKYVWANMAVDLLRYQHAVNSPIETDPAGDAQTSGAVSSIKEGDTTVSFGGKSSDEADRDRALDTHKAKLDSLILNYTKQLQGYRKLRW